MPAGVGLLFNRNHHPILGSILYNVGDQDMRVRVENRRARDAVIYREAGWWRGGIAIDPQLRYGHESPPMIAVTGSSAVGKTTLVRMLGRYCRDAYVRPDHRVLPSFGGITVIRTHTDRPMRSSERILPESEREHIHVSRSRMDELWPDRPQFDRPIQERAVTAVRLAEEGYRYVIRYAELYDALVRGWPIVVPCSSPEVAVGLKSGLPLLIVHTVAETELREGSRLFEQSKAMDDGDIIHPPVRMDHSPWRQRYDLATSDLVWRSVTLSEFERIPDAFYVIEYRPDAPDLVAYNGAEFILSLAYAMASENLREDPRVRGEDEWAFSQFRVRKRRLLDFISGNHELIIEQAQRGREQASGYSLAKFLRDEWELPQYEYHSPLHWGWVP